MLNFLIVILACIALNCVTAIIILKKVKTYNEIFEKRCNDLQDYICIYVSKMDHYLEKEN